MIGRINISRIYIACLGSEVCKDRLIVAPPNFFGSLNSIYHFPVFLLRYFILLSLICREKPIDANYNEVKMGNWGG